MNDHDPNQHPTYPVSSDDDYEPNDGEDDDDDGSFFDELVGDEEGSSMEEFEGEGEEDEEEEEYADEGSAELNDNHENEEGSYIDEEGSYIDEEGSYIDEEEGSFVDDEEASFVDNEDGSFVNEEGSYVDEEGSYIDEEGSYIDEEGSYIDEDEYDNPSFYDDTPSGQEPNDENDDDGSYIEEEIIEGDDDDDVDDEFITAPPAKVSPSADRYRSPVRQQKQQQPPSRSVTPSEEPGGSMNRNNNTNETFHSQYEYDTDDDDDEQQQQQQQYHAHSGEDFMDESEAVDESRHNNESAVDDHHFTDDENADFSNSQSDASDIDTSDANHTTATNTTDFHQQQQVQQQLQYQELPAVSYHVDADADISENNSADDDKSALEYDYSYSQSMDHGSDEHYTTTATVTTDEHQQQQQVQQQMQYRELKESGYVSSDSNDAFYLPHDNEGSDEEGQEHDENYEDYEDGHQSYESGMLDYDDNDSKAQSDNNSDGQHSCESGSSGQYDDQDYTDADQQVPKTQNNPNDMGQQNDDEYDNDANSYESGHSQQYDDDDAADEVANDEQLHEPQSYDDDYDDERFNGYDGDEKSYDDDVVYDNDPRFGYEGQDDDDRPDDDDDGQESYASSAVSDGDDQQSYIDENDDQQSYASGASEEVDREREHNQSDDDYEDNEYLSDDGQVSNESQDFNHDGQQQEYDDAADIDIEEDNNAIYQAETLHDVDRQDEQYGSSDEDIGSYQSGSDDASHDNFENIDNHTDVNGDYGDEEVQDVEQTYEYSREPNEGHVTNFNDTDRDEGSSVSDDGSQQSDNEEYEDNEGQLYANDDVDDASFMSTMIGPPPFVDNDDTNSDDYAETEYEDDPAKEHYLVSDDEGDFVGDAMQTRKSSVPSESDDDEVDDDAEWSDQSASTASRSQEFSSKHSSSIEKSPSHEGMLRNVSLESRILAPSYHSMKSDTRSSNDGSSSYVSLSKSAAPQNVGVDTDFSGFTSKASNFESKDHIAPKGVSTHSRKSYDDKSRSSANHSNKPDSSMDKDDELFIVNTSNRGAQSKMFYYQQRQASGDFSIDTMNFDIDNTTRSDVENINEPSNDDPASDIPNSYTTEATQEKSIKITRNNSTDSETFFRVTNQYLTADTEDNDAVKNESVRSNRSYFSDSNHAAAKFESPEGKRISFVGSDDDSSSADIDDDGFEHDASDVLPGSNEIHTVSTDSMSLDKTNVQNQYKVLREMAMEIVSSDIMRPGTCDTESSKSSPTKALAHAETFIHSTETTSRNIPDAKLGNLSSKAAHDYQVYNCNVQESAVRENNKVYFPTDHVEKEHSFEASLVGNKLSVSNPSPSPSTLKTLRINTDEEMQIGTSDSSESSLSSLSSKEDMSLVSKDDMNQENANQDWNSKLPNSEQIITRMNQAPTDDLEATRHIANSRSQFSTSAPSNADDELTISHPWLPSEDKKRITPLLNKTLSSSDEIDTSDMKDIETGLYEREEQAPSHHRKDTSNTQKKRASRKRPKWIYGAMAIGFLFVFMLLVVLLTKSKKDSSSPDIPQVVPTPSPATSEPLATPSSESMLFILQTTLLGSSENAFGFGSSVAINNDLITVGEPGVESVKSYYVLDEKWVEESTVAIEMSNSQFGKALDLVNGTLAVGAPFMTTDVNATVGVHVYSHDPSQRTWKDIGSTLRGDVDLAIPDEGFGSSVAVSYELQVIVGAPRYSRDSSNTGRVYTFKYKESSDSWISNELFALVGEGSDDLFGTSVAISRDGTRFIAGAPGMSSPGYVRIYYWIDTRWQLLSVLRGEHDNENCGSSAVILSDVGEYVAIGCPGFDNGAGRVAVYQQQMSTGKYQQIGPDLVGEPGDGIGYNNGVTGDVSTSGPIIILATRNGRVLRYDYDIKTNTWMMLFSPISISVTDQASLAFTSSEGVDTLVIGLSGSSNHTLIYTADSITTTTGTPIESTLFPIMAPQPPSAMTSSPSASSSFSSTNIPVTTITPTVQLQPEITLAPTPKILSPAAPVVAETPPASLSPINDEYLWTVAGGPFEIATDDSTSSSNSSSIPVTSVALGGTRMVMGASSLGVVQSFLQQTLTIISVWETKPYQNLYGSSADDASEEYGAATDMMDDLLIVGAPGNLGAAYCYRIDATTGDWALFGSIVLQEQSTTTGQERFGSSVSVCTGSTNPRLAVGAPNYGSEDSSLVQSGRVSIYEYDTTIMDWRKNANDILGVVSYEHFGTAIDLCTTGNFIVIGGPGSGDSSNGTATVYQYSTLGWYPVTTISGEESNERFGSSVHMLSDDGFIVAIGGPNYGTNRGRVVVYERNALTGKYELVGVPIIGEVNEHIGLPNTLSGSSNLSKVVLKVIVQTANGYVKLYEYNKSVSTAWTSKTIAVTDSSLSGENVGVFAIAANSDASSIVVATNGANNSATILNET